MHLKIHVGSEPQSGGTGRGTPEAATRPTSNLQAGECGGDSARPSFPFGSREAECVPQLPSAPGEGKGASRASLHTRPPSRPRHLCPPGRVQLEAAPREQLPTMNKGAPRAAGKGPLAVWPVRVTFLAPTARGWANPPKTEPTENKYLSTLNNGLSAIGDDWLRG